MNHQQKLLLIVLIHRRMWSKGKKLYFAFVDLEKVCDRVAREITRRAWRKAGVEEWLVNAVMAMYEGAQMKDLSILTVGDLYFVRLQTDHENKCTAIFSGTCHTHVQNIVDITSG